MGGEGSCGALLRGLQHLGASLKRFLLLRCEDVIAVCCFEVCRTSELPGKETGCHFLHRAKSNQKARGTPSCDLDSNRRSIRDCCENDRHSSSNRQRRKRQFPGIAGNDLNRCEVPALQHKIRANSKRIVVFFANSRLRVV